MDTEKGPLTTDVGAQVGAEGHLLPGGHLSELLPALLDLRAALLQVLGQSELRPLVHLLLHRPIQHL